MSRATDARRMPRDSLPAITQYPNPVTKANNAKQRAPCPYDAGPAKNEKTRSARIASALTSTLNIPKKWEYSIVKIATPLSIADPSLLYNPPLHLSAMRQAYSIPNAVVKSNVPFRLNTQGIFDLSSQGYLLRVKNTRQCNSLILNCLAEGCIRNAHLIQSKWRRQIQIGNRAPALRQEPLSCITFTGKSCRSHPRRLRRSKPPAKARKDSVATPGSGTLHSVTLKEAFGV